MQVDVTFHRAAKVAPLLGPQGYGQIPTLTEFRVSAFNHQPSAQCGSVYVSATDDTVANGGSATPTNTFAIGGVVGNAAAGVCTQGAPITIDDSSFDSDTQDADALITTGTTTGTTIVSVPSCMAHGGPSPEPLPLCTQVLSWQRCTVGSMNPLRLTVYQIYWNGISPLFLALAFECLVGPGFTAARLK